MYPIQWMTEAMRISIRTGLVMAEMQTTMFLRMLAVSDKSMPDEVVPADKAAPSAAAQGGKGARRARVGG